MADPSLDSNPKVNLSTKQQQRNAKIGMGFLLQQIRSSAPSQSSSICPDEPATKKLKEENNEIDDHQKPSTSSTNSFPLTIILDGKTRPNIDLPIDKEFYNNLAPIQVISDCFRQGTTPDFGPVIRRFVGENNYVRSCKWSLDGKWLITDSVDHFVRIFAYSNDKLSFHLKLPFGGIVYDHQWSPNVAHLQFATTSQGQPIHCWSPDEGKLLCSFRGINDQDELDSAYSICHSLDGRNIFAGYRNRLRIFDLERPGRQIRDIKTFQRGTVMAAQKGICSALAICPTFDGVFAVSTYSGSIGLYSTHTNACDCLIGGNDGSAITHLQYSTNGNMLFAGYRQNPLIKCFDLRMPTRLLATYLRSAQTSQRFYFHLDPHDRYLYTGSSEGELLIYELENGQQTAGENEMCPIEPNYRIKCSQAAVTGLSLHPDDQIVAISTGQRLFPSDFLTSCLFADQSPNGEEKKEENFSYSDLGKDASSFLDNSIKLYRMNSPIS